MDQEQLSPIPFSVLDLAVVAEGKTPADAFAQSLDLAREAEKLGYKRFWMAEHHNMEHVASSATSVLLSYIAGGTTSIRVGSGGIMLPNHTPLIVAEQFGTLATLYPGRIDLGLGRAPGTDQTTALAIRRERFHAADSFPEDIRELQSFLSDDNSEARVRAFPGEGTNIPIFLLGSSTFSALLAADYGLPYAFASHFAPREFLRAVRLYRENFKPSEYLQTPYVMSCINVIAAPTDEEAEFLSSSMKLMFRGIVTGLRRPLQPPVKNIDDIWTEMEREAVYQMLAVSFIGGPESLRSGIQSFREQTGVDEVIVSSNIYDHQDRLRSYRLFAEVMKSFAGTT
ncbi:luciferase family oxidoreductase group 1 [Anseongella ginsenosidimutans]|uniref:Luciferase-like monooxygenase n=1 Tax=Anseongella ginsenosidimutans TaxID=496056 RepID=A0A4R3KMJ4_9SPHI|nr:LLM class flavin-dependent oxidoreductase [Anseongella ginsenosidimutans]QEC52775.1 LLM class flavin-dependent oxidoreductase [Anseongella ginsenosidimutans]TCS85535.1 luciferase family oxidoreductase group 1 [Anseongella ginsenosidimutans]